MVFYIKSNLFMFEISKLFPTDYNLRSDIPSYLAIYSIVIWVSNNYYTFILSNRQTLLMLLNILKKGKVWCAQENQFTEMRSNDMLLWCLAKHFSDLVLLLCDIIQNMIPIKRKMYKTLFNFRLRFRMHETCKYSNMSYT